MSELHQYLLGNATKAMLQASLIFVTIATIGMLIYRISKRDKNSPRTPEKFSIKFFIQDNWLKVVYTTLFILLGLRIVYAFKMEANITILLSIILGICSDYLGTLFTKARKKSIDVVEDKLDDVASSLKDTKTSVEKSEDKIEQIKSDVADIKEKQE